MKKKSYNLKIRVLVLFILISFSGYSQFLMDMVDTTTNLGKSMFSIYRKFDNFSVTGYIQPQYQVVGAKGAKSFGGGDFTTYSDNRFMLRRGRIRFDYSRFTNEGMPKIHFVFQFDGTDKGVFARDFWGRLYDTKYNLFILSAGIMPRPFGFEVNLGSSDRESPERGRMSQSLMKIERDLGAMISFEPRGKNHPLRFLKIDVGAFNGPGLPGSGEIDSYKDIIGRFGLKSTKITGNWFLSGGLSFFEGGLVNNYTEKYTFKSTGFSRDSSGSIKGAKMPRQYQGIDLQLKHKSNWGNTELRFEYWQGTQTGTAALTESPASLLSEPLYIRKFNGAFIYFLQFINGNKHQVGFKLDWYDPNTEVTGKNIGLLSKTGWADVKYTTYGFGYNYYMNPHTRLMLWYDIIRNENTSLAAPVSGFDYRKDVKDNLFTCRLQFRF